MSSTVKAPTPAQPSQPADGPWRSTLCVAVILFAVFSFAGWVYETVENLFSFGGVYLRASLLLPWCPIYGVGGLVIVGALEPLRRRLLGKVPAWAQATFVCVAIYVLTALVELAGSYVCEAIMGYVPWDYSAAWLNLDGRIAPAYTLRFVVLGLVALYGVYPPIERWVASHLRAATIVAAVLLGLFALDNVLQALGVWAPVKDALVSYGISHW